MGTLLEIGLSNAAVASVLALLAAAGARLVRRPALAHALWLLVLLKLLTPPLVTVPIAWPGGSAEPIRDMPPVSPVLWTIGRTPRLLFPAGLLERLDREQREALLAHELAHWRRRDHWVRLVELAVLVLYWWHPVVWWARRELHEAEEQCCDAWA